MEPNLEKAVHDHTQDVLAALKKQGTAPDMVQIGNEISNGFLWPDGEVWKSGKWDVFCGLIKAGIAGAKEVDPAVKTMIHLAWGGQNAQSRSFLDKALAQGVEFDIIGQSYYPKWHGTLDELKANLTDLAGRYKQDIMVVEYSVPNIREINDIVHGLPGGKGARHLHLGTDEMGRASVVRRQGEHEARDRRVPEDGRGLRIEAVTVPHKPHYLVGLPITFSIVEE